MKGARARRARDGSLMRACSCSVARRGHLRGATPLLQLSKPFEPYVCVERRRLGVRIERTIPAIGEVRLRNLLEDRRQRAESLTEYFNRHRVKPGYSKHHRTVSVGDHTIASRAK